MGPFCPLIPWCLFKVDNVQLKSFFAGYRQFVVCYIKGLSFIGSEEVGSDGFVGVKYKISFIQHLGLVAVAQSVREIPSSC